MKLLPTVCLHIALFLASFGLILPQTHAQNPGRSFGSNHSNIQVHKKQPAEVRATDAESVEACIHIWGGLATADFTRAEGPRITLKSLNKGAFDLTKKPTYKVGQYNVENLLEYQGNSHYDEATGEWIWVPDPSAKPAERLDQVAEVEKRAGDDSGFWEEVEGEKPAEEVSRTKLDDKYGFLTAKGNDQRKIDVPFKFDKNDPLDYTFQSYRNVKTTVEGVVKDAFSRDFPVVEIRLAGHPDSEPPLLIMAGTHFKSQRDSNNDPRSVKYRTAQVKVAAKILQDYERKYPNTPILMMGDFNADLRRTGGFQPQAEFLPLWEIGMVDAFDAAPRQTAPADRITHMFFPKGGQPVYGQLDGILLNQTAVKAGILLSADIIPYMNSDGTPMAIPTSYDERLKQGSDHRKIQVTLDLAKLIKLNSTPH